MRFQLLCSPFVRQALVNMVGIPKQMNPDDLKTMALSDTQVHGKNFFLAFGTIQKVVPSCESTSPESLNTGHKWLRFHFCLYGRICTNEFARANKANKRRDWKDPIPKYEWLVLHLDGGRLLVFYGCQIQQCSSPVAEPATDILSPEFNQEQVMEALRKATSVSLTPGSRGRAEAKEWQELQSSRRVIHSSNPEVNCGRGTPGPGADLCPRAPASLGLVLEPRSLGLHQAAQIGDFPLTQESTTQMWLYAGPP
ncbi:endonuclease 8-like 2 [Rhineura floridana]|uniref:endonuclease 8-like 2 n=1 Tax=Rhineura floridana TaxID=261503 RepID=UPI002AC84D72|nr:endonuclease 8-like 2 [Rhineura floridana]